PYRPVRGQDRQGGPFGFGIVAELLTVRPDGRVLRASLYLYDPARRELFMGPNGIPEFVDCHGSEFELYKRADDMGYTPPVPRAPAPRPPAREGGGRGPGGGAGAAPSLGVRPPARAPPAVPPVRPGAGPAAAPETRPHPPGLPFRPAGRDRHSTEGRTGPTLA